MASLNLGGGLVRVLFLTHLFLMIHTLPLLAEETPKGGKNEEVAQNTKAKDGVEGEEGIASYYAKRYNGRRTNSGERYRPEKLTAAHADLPLGTRVRVVNKSNGKEVVVRVNDRCRRRKSPFIDLSRRAARELGFLGKGTARVRIIPLTEES